MTHETVSDGIAVKDSLSVIRRGRVYMVTEQAVTPADKVFYRFAAGAGGAAIGRVRKDADTATAEEFAGAAFMGSAGAGEIVAVEVNIP